jgi:peptidoglycan/LPS O-acetylase OafA/YrhL
MSQQSSKYRPDIDGLPALAIAGVLVFHIEPSLLSGGYVGVDVFFVISGFLITSILHRNLASGSFSFADFYERRILRIFPAFLIVLLATLVVGYLMLFSAPLEIGQSLFLFRLLVGIGVGGAGEVIGI